jgi:hypothetical protein
MWNVIYNQTAELKLFLQEFQRRTQPLKGATANATQVSQVLVECNDLCRIHPEANLDVMLHISGVSIIASNNLQTVGISRLTSIIHPTSQVYNEGRTLFLNNINNPDLFSSSPLEASFVWT